MARFKIFLRLFFLEMYQSTKQSVFYSLIFISAIFSCGSALAQNDLKTLLDQTVVEKQAGRTKPKLPKQTFSIQKYDSVSSIKKDTINLLREKLQMVNIIPFDTTGFINRNQTVKNRSINENVASETELKKKYLVTQGNVYKKEHKLDSTRKVLGWHPYWLGNTYLNYNFSLLSAVGYTSYEMNPATGYYNSIHDWRTTKLFDSAHAHQCKVLMSVTNYGVENNTLFLSNVKAQQVFISTLITLLRERNGDGVIIDFEDVPLSMKTNLTNFMIDLSSSLRAADKDYMITIALPAIDFDGVYDVKQLNKHLDLFIIMGYEFYGINSAVAGPLAPLSSGKNWQPYNLERAVDEYLVSGAEPLKLLLGLPYYGVEWQTTDLKIPSKAEKIIRYMTYRNIKKECSDLNCFEDAESKSKFYVYRDNNNKYRQIWYDDEESLA